MGKKRAVNAASSESHTASEITTWLDIKKTSKGSITTARQSMSATRVSQGEDSITGMDKRIRTIGGNLILSGKMNIHIFIKLHAT